MPTTRVEVTNNRGQKLLATLEKVSVSKPRGGLVTVSGQFVEIESRKRFWKSKQDVPEADIAITIESWFQNQA